jgi:hypothetical protein
MFLPLNRPQLFASALLLCIGGVWLWTRSSQQPGVEISGQEGVRPAAQAPQSGPTSTKAGVLPFEKNGESQAARSTRLLTEAKALLNDDLFEDLLEYVDIGRSWEKNELGKLRRVSRSPQFQRWRELVKELIEAGPVADAEALLWPDEALPLSHDRLGMSYQAKQIKLLEGLSRLDGDEADPEALLDAVKLNQALSPSDSISHHWVTIKCNEVLQDRLAESLTEQSPEALSGFTKLLQESRLTQSQVTSAMLKDDRKRVLDLLKAPAESKWLAMEDPRLENNKNRLQNELQAFCDDAIQIQKLQQSLRDLDPQFHQTWEQGSDWPRRLQAVRDFRVSLDRRLGDSVSEDLREILARLISPSQTRLLHLIDLDAQRESLAVAFQVEEFRRKQGRLPANLEEVGGSPSSLAALSYEVKDGKARLSIPQNAPLETYAHNNGEATLISFANRPFEVKW